MKSYLDFFNNQWVASDTGASVAVDNPASGDIIGSVSAASTEQVLAACDMAAAA